MRYIYKCRNAPWVSSLYSNHTLELAHELCRRSREHAQRWKVVEDQ